MSSRRMGKLKEKVENAESSSSWNCMEEKKREESRAKKV